MEKQNKYCCYSSLSEYDDPPLSEDCKGCEKRNYLNCKIYFEKQNQLEKEAQK